MTRCFATAASILLVIAAACGGDWGNPDRVLHLTHVTLTEQEFQTEALPSMVDGSGSSKVLCAALAKDLR